MTVRSTRTLAALAFIAIVAGVPFGVVGDVPAASAHNQVVATTPAANETVTSPPAAFTVTTNDAMLDLGGEGGFAIDVVGPDGLHYADGCLTVVDATLSGAAGLGPAGAYRMVYQLVSADGHTVSGEVPFTWAPESSAVTGVGTTAARACGEAAPAATPDAETSAPSEEPTAPVPTEQAEQGPETPAGSGTSSVPISDVLWIGGAVLAVLVAAGVTLLIVTRRRKT